MWDEEENPLPYYSSPGTLISIASTKVALLCWHHQLVHLKFNPDEIRSMSADWFTKHRFRSVEIFRVPNRVGDLIDRHIKLTGQELERWWCRHENVFNGTDYEIMLKFTNHLIFDPNGLVNYKSTAVNLLASGKLNPKEAFRISCKYSLESDIERLWPSVSKKYENFLDYDFDLDENAALIYWIFRMKNQLDKLPGDEQESAEFRVISAGKLQLWSEVEFFWNKLDERQRSSRIKQLLSERRLVKYLLPKLNKQQLDQALRQCFESDIFYGLAKYDTNNIYALQTWNYVKDSIHKNNFGPTVYDLMKLAFVELKWGYEHVAVLVYEIWSTASDHLKNHILEGNNEVYFDDLFEPDNDCDMRWYGRDMRFHLDIFANTTRVPQYMYIWSKNWRKVMLLATPSDFDKFLRIMWGDDESEIEFFKKHEMVYKDKTRRYFDKFIENGLCDELIDYLKYCSADDEELQNRMKQIIDSNLNQMHNYRFTSLVKFSEFIDKAFSSPDLAQQFKQEFIRERLESWLDLLNESHLTGVKNIIECFVSSDAELLLEYKQRCLERCKHNLTTGTLREFKIHDWKEFLLWCAPNEEEITNFKKSISIDEVFHVMLTKAIGGEYAVMPVLDNEAGRCFAAIIEQFCPNSKVMMSFSPLRAFLSWYFETAEAVKTFKRDTIKKYKEIKALTDMFEEGDEKTIEHVMNFFFDHDADQILQFLFTNGLSGSKEEDEEESDSEETSGDEKNTDGEGMDEDGCSESDEDDIMDVAE